ncbi:hypothetical protein GCM10007972_23350 [Iodidimonas muriae]|uniref:HEAT repeat domain-containing protein n=1 Tax=Iodidimonas muriae TaxID=261467 RepID=A0ABQ2LF89_9PROT|nr:hypothetical protein [Iodidimonas muriae]GGO15327.1 hypothetical protein GCM10007972_23350 [Iodidimonas muriae]
MAVFHQYLLWICVFLALGLSLSACGESGLPDYDENATYNGRTLSEVTPGLSDINPERRMLTLRDVAQFGVNALPAREKIRIMAQEDTDDRVKVGALATLHQMQDPQLPDLFSKLLSDPQYTAQSRTWQELVNRAPEVLGEEELEDFAAQVTKDNPEHAEMLFSLAVNTDAASAFGVALMDRDVSPSTTQKLMIVMPDMDLPDPRKIDWIKDHHMQMPNLRVALQTLQRMGGQEALDASLALLAEYPLASVADYRQTLRAFSGSMPPAQSIKIYGGLIEKTGQSEQDLQSLFGEMAGLVARLKQSSAVVRNSAQGEQAQADYRQAQDAYHDMLQNLMAHDLPLVRALAAGSLIDATVQDPLEPRRLMTPAFQLLKNEEQEVVIGTIVQRLKGVLPRIDYNAHPDLVEALAESIYARPSEDKWAYAVADGVVKAFDSAMRSRRLPQELAIPNVVDQSLAHTGHMANSRVFDWLATWMVARNFSETLGDEATTVSENIGKLALDSSISQAQMETFFSRASIERLPIPERIAFMDPIALSKDDKITGQWGTRFFQGALGSSIYNLRGHPEQDRYVAWVRKIAEKGHPTLQPIARQGLERFAPQ